MDDRPRGATLRRLRGQVVARDGLVCGRCHQAIAPHLSGLHPMGLTLGHVIPRHLGGVDTVGNLQPEHRVCNLGDRHPGALVGPLPRAHGRGQGGSRWG
jgi:5-methylcytosine-specific restriction endonuclease McrA